MNTFKRKALFAAVVAGLGVALGGCASWGATGMTPEQITALAKDDSATAFCSKVTTDMPNVTVKSAYARVDKGAAPLEVGEDCQITYFPLSRVVAP